MLGSYQRLSLLGTLLLSSVATANRFAFSIQNITILNTNQIEDDLTLSIAASTPNGNATKDYFLGAFNDNGTMRQENYTLEIDLGATLANFSVVFGVVKATENQTNQLADILLAGAANLTTQASQNPTSSSTNTSSTLDQVNGLLSDDCPAARLVGNTTYYTNSSDRSELDIAKFQIACTFRTYLYEPPSENCGSASNYSVSFCLQWLDKKENGAGGVVPGVAGSFLAMGIALLFGAFI